MNEFSVIDKVALRAELMKMPVADLEAYTYRMEWLRDARPAQKKPSQTDHRALNGVDWNIWLLMAGRGFGKTRPGAEECWWTAYQNPGHRCHVIAPTHGDLRGVCFEGESGLLARIPPTILKNYNSSLAEITLAGKCGGPDSLIKGFSATEPDRLRGPQAHWLWGDELAAWQYAQETFDMAMLGLRLGDYPWSLFTTTPKPVELVRNLLKRKDVVLTRGTTYENRANLAATFFDQIKQYEGTVLGRQELEGELIDPEESGVIKRSQIKMWPADKPLPAFEHILMSLDTAFTEKTYDEKKKDPDYTGCSIWGVFHNTVTQRLEALLLDAWMERLGLPDLEVRVKKEMTYHYGVADKPVIRPLVGPAVLEGQGRKVDTVVIEDKGAGISLRQYLMRAGISAYAYNPGRADKLARLHLASPFYAQGQVWMPESDKRPGSFRTWCEPLIAQLCSFPNCTHDDLMDTATQALRVLSDMQLLRSMKKVERYVDELPRAKNYKRDAIYG